MPEPIVIFKKIKGTGRMMGTELTLINPPAVFILGFEKSGGSAPVLWKNMGNFQKMWGIIR